MKEFNGPVLFLDRSDINTDEIIPARYLTEITREALKPHLFEDLDLPGFRPEKDIPGKKVIISRENFGCGSSREHAPWALEVNGLYTVLAPGFARIFRQNMFNCGLLAVDLSEEDCREIFQRFAGTEANCTIHFDSSTLEITSLENRLSLTFSLSKFERDLIQAGGWVDFADSRYEH
ncbi:MAG: 3-isopropylmalate dehydratase small subunit [Spirochaetales bacterium]|nr:3-isopropylmalate dehydratase small subunit [Spirochaetales bacterium]